MEKRKCEPVELMDLIVEAIALLRTAGKDVLTIDECAAYSGYKRDTIYAAISRREFATYRHGNRTFVKRDDLENWLANPDKRVPSADEIRSKAAAYCLGKEAGWKN